MRKTYAHTCRRFGGEGVQGDIQNLHLTRDGVFEWKENTDIKGNQIKGMGNLGRFTNLSFVSYRKDNNLYLSSKIVYLVYLR